jgi:hypothetical protein
MRKFLNMNCDETDNIIRLKLLSVFISSSVTGLANLVDTIGKCRIAEASIPERESSSMDEKFVFMLCDERTLSYVILASPHLAPRCQRQETNDSLHDNIIQLLLLLLLLAFAFSLPSSSAKVSRSLGLSAMKSCARDSAYLE